MFGKPRCIAGIPKPGDGFCKPEASFLGSVMHYAYRRLLLFASLFILLFIHFTARGDSRIYPCKFKVQGVPAGVTRKVMQYTLHSSGDGIVLMLEGAINAGESQRLEQAIRVAIGRGPISEVWLNSGGGNAIEGMKMGQVLRRYGVATRVASGNMCFSACSYAFLGGPFRAVEEGGEYGVHMFTASSSTAGTVAKGVVRDAQTNRNLDNTADIVQGIEQDSAKFASIFLDYLSEMGISSEVGTHNFATANKSGSCPPATVLKEWNVVNSD